MKDLLDYCDAHAEEIVETTEALAALESPSTDKAAVDRCGADLAARLRASGAAVELVPQDLRGDHVIGRIPGRELDGAVLILGHFDTVWPVGTLARMPIRRDGDRLHGPGVFDMKAGIALALTAIGALRASAASHPSITMVWTTDEEIGSGTSRALIEAEARRAQAVLVLEPALPGGALKTARKGCGEFEITVHGVAAHAGLDPGKGASAIHELAAQIAIVARLQDLPRGISVNVGVVSGGTRPNVVAEEARAIVDARAPTRAAAAEIESAFLALKPVQPRTRLSVKGGFDRPPMERGPGVVELFGRASRIAASFGRELREGSAGGGSDGNFTAALGVPTLDGLGAAGDGAHAAHEYVDISALPWRAALIAGLLRTFTETGRIDHA